MGIFVDMGGSILDELVSLTFARPELKSKSRIERSLSLTRAGFEEVYLPAQTSGRVCSSSSTDYGL